MKTEKTSLLMRTGLLIIVVILLSVVQVIWLLESIRVQKAELHEKLVESAQKMADALEKDYYCFTLTTKANIAKGGEFHVEVPNNGDTTEAKRLAMFPRTLEGLIRDTVFQKLQFSVPADVVLDLHFELRDLANAQFPDSLDERERIVKESYQRSILRNGYRLLDTVTFHKLLKTVSDEMGHGAEVMCKVLVNNGDSFVYERGAMLTPTVETQKVIYSEIPFLPRLRLQFGALDTNPFYRQMPFWILTLALLLMVFLFVLIQSFIKTIRGQKRLSEMKDDLISNLTHEFNTPVTNIALALRNLQPNSEKEKLAIEIISEENKRISRNIEMVMAPGAIDDLIGHENFDPLDIHAILEMSTEHIALMVRERKGSLSVDLSAHNSIVKGEESHLISAFGNVLDNALKYSPGTPEIEVKTYNRGSKIFIEIKDYGMGMDSEKIEEIFDRFYRIGDQLKHDVKGFGLGLYFAKKVAKLHSGNLTAKSQVGKGSTFTFSFTTQ